MKMDKNDEYSNKIRSYFPEKLTVHYPLTGFCLPAVPGDKRIAGPMGKIVMGNATEDGQFQAEYILNKVTRLKIEKKLEEV